MQQLPQDRAFCIAMLCTWWRLSKPGSLEVQSKTYKSSPPIPTNTIAMQSNQLNPPPYATSQTITTTPDNQIPRNFIMVASITKLPNDPKPDINFSSHLSALSEIENGSHLWLIDSAASSHLSGNKPIFLTLEDILPILIKYAGGDTFVADQKGSINILQFV